MKQSKTTARIILRYALLQLPGLGLFVGVLILAGRWVTFSSSVAWGLVGLWILKDVVLFPFVRRAYETTGPSEASMVGQQGVAKERLAPSGYIQVRGELWKAELTQGASAVDKGMPVSVQGIRGLTLLVHPVAKDPTPHESPLE